MKKEAHLYLDTSENSDRFESKFKEAGYSDADITRVPKSDPHNRSHPALYLIATAEWRTGPNSVERTIDEKLAPEN